MNAVVIVVDRASTAQLLRVSAWPFYLTDGEAPPPVYNGSEAVRTLRQCCYSQIESERHLRSSQS